jgi:hypothetical protein
VVELCQCPRASWNAELQSDELGCVAEELSKQQSIPLIEASMTTFDCLQ